MNDFNKIDQTPAWKQPAFTIKMEMKDREVRDLQQVLNNHPSIMSEHAADLIRKIALRFEKTVSMNPTRG